MLSREAVLRFQRMTPEERFQIALELTDSAWNQLESLPEAERELRWRVIRRDHDRSGERLLEHLRKHDRLEEALREAQDFWKDRR